MSAKGADRGKAEAAERHRLQEAARQKRARTTPEPTKTKKKKP